MEMLRRLENAEESAKHLCMRHQLEREEESAAHRRELQECRTTLALEFTKQSEEQHRSFTKKFQKVSVDISELRESCNRLQKEKQEALLKLDKKDRLQIWSLLINDQSLLGKGEAVKMYANTDSTDQHHLPRGNKHQHNANMKSQKDEMHLSERFQGSVLCELEKLRERYDERVPVQQAIKFLEDSVVKLEKNIGVVMKELENSLASTDDQKTEVPNVVIPEGEASKQIIQKGKNVEVRIKLPDPKAYVMVSKLLTLES